VVANTTCSTTQGFRTSFVEKSAEIFETCDHVLLTQREKLVDIGRKGVAFRSIRSTLRAKEKEKG
jgi:hypothetical protein